jgi:hypothetical protein
VGAGQAYQDPLCGPRGLTLLITIIDAELLIKISMEGERTSARCGSPSSTPRSIASERLAGREKNMRPRADCFPRLGSAMMCWWRPCRACAGPS